MRRDEELEISERGIDGFSITLQSVHLATVVIWRGGFIFGSYLRDGGSWTEQHGVGGASCGDGGGTGWRRRG